jgi:hypothetical protein
MAQRCILKTRAQIDGAIREPGYQFVLPSGKRGPMRASRAAHEQINQASGLYERIEPDRGEDVPLYDVIEEIPDVAPGPSLDQRIAAKRAELEAIAVKGRPVWEELQKLEAERDAGRKEADKGSPPDPVPAGTSSIPATAAAGAAPPPLPQAAPWPPTPDIGLGQKGASERLDGSF